MTEKRYEIQETTKHDFIDTIDGKGYCYGEGIDLLNEFYEENQHLRQILDLGQTDAKGVVNVLNMQQEKIRTILKENKELKHENVNIMSDLDYYRVKSGSCEEGLFEKDKEIAKLEKENKGLKQLIDLFAQDICDLTEILSKNQLDYKLHSDVENFIIKWGVRIE